MLRLLFNMLLFAGSSKKSRRNTRYKKNKYNTRYKKSNYNTSYIENTSNTFSNEEKNLPSLSNNLKENLENIKNAFGTSFDVIIREFSFGPQNKINAAIIYLDGMIEKITVNDNIIKPLMYYNSYKGEDSINPFSLDSIKKTMISVSDVENTASMDEIIDGCLSGDTVFIIDGASEALIIETKGWETRNIEEPKTEAVVRGPREGFGETLKVNITMMRRKIKNHNLTFETMNIGRQTKTSVTIAYIKGIVEQELVNEIKQRLKKINIDAILESGYIEQYIEDAPYSIFPTIGNCEKPDATAAKILEGRVAIFVDGTPFVLTIPMLFIEGFQTAEDYYSRAPFVTLLRLIRILSFFINILAPATYVIMTTFHQELIPTPLLFSLATSREGVPFPAVIEAGLMIFTFEILREAGVRLPRPVGQAVSIVGALVIGQAAVTAGLVSGLMIIVVAITAVSSFVVPVYTDSAAILRLVFLILGGTLGIFGLTVGFLAVLVHLASIRSFGAPYLSPLAPLTTNDLNDTLIRGHIWKMNTRPRVIARNNIIRQKTSENNIQFKEK